MFQITVKAEDWFSKYTGFGSTEVQLPKALLSRAIFPNLSADLIDKPFPYVFGDYTATGASALAPPTPTANYARDEVYSDGWIAGYGDVLGCLATPPTALTVGNTSGGNVNLGKVHGNRYGCFVTAIDSNGVESNAFPFTITTHVEDTTITSDGRKITASWSGGTGAVMYRCYVGHYYYGFRPTQYIETASTSCEFTDVPGIGDYPGVITSGASYITGSAIWYYAVSAIASDGETSRSVEWTWVNRAQTQFPSYLSWTPVTGATGYRVYVRGTVGGWFAYKETTDTFLTDYHDYDVSWVRISSTPQFQGPIPITPVGKLPDVNGYMMEAFLVSAGAMMLIDSLYFNGVKMDPGGYGVTWYVPGKSGFTARFGDVFRDIAGTRMTLVYGLGPQADDVATGAATLSCTGQGLESNGDATGILYDVLPDQYVMILRNLILRDVRDGQWLASGPTWNDSPIDVDLVDQSSFNDVKTRWESRLSGGCKSAFILGRDEQGSLAQASVNEWLARMNLSMDVRSTAASRKAQYTVSPFFRTIDDLNAATEYTDQLHILKDSFKITDYPERIENQITIQYALDMTVSMRKTTDTTSSDTSVVPPTSTQTESPWTVLLKEDRDAQVALQEIRPKTLILWCIRSQAIAGLIGDSRLARRRFAPRTIEWDSDMGGLIDDLGTMVLISHLDGYGPTGYVRQPGIITRHEFDPTGLIVHFTVEDVAWMFDTTLSAIQPVTGGAGESAAAESIAMALQLARVLRPAQMIAMNNDMGAGILD